MNVRTAATVLLAGAIIWLIVDGYWMIERLSGGAWNFYKKHPFKLIVSNISIFVPITLIIFSAIMMKTPDAPANTNTPPPPPSDHFSYEDASTPVPSIGDWLVNYLVMAIPLVGFVFLIIWANDNSNRVRKNWAGAMLIWSGIIFFIFLIFILAASDSRRSYYD